MKMYVLFGVLDLTDREMLGVYSTRDAAHGAQRAYAERAYDDLSILLFNSYAVEELELNAPADMRDEVPEFIRDENVGDPLN